MINEERLIISQALSTSDTEASTSDAPSQAVAKQLDGLSSTPISSRQAESLVRRTRLSQVTPVASPTTRLVRRKLDVLTEIKRHSDLVTEAANNLRESLVKHLQKQNECAAPKNKKKVKRSFGEVLTEATVVERMEEEEREKSLKKANIEENKRKRVEKKTM